MKKQFLVLIICFSVLASCADAEKEARYASIIEIVGNDAICLHELASIDLEATLYGWKNRVVLLGVFEDAAKVHKLLSEACPNASVRLYDEPFYVFDRNVCEQQTQTSRQTHIVMTANLVACSALQREYMDYHERQAELFPEVASGFCRANFQQLLLFRNERQLMLVISIPEGASLDDLNPKTTENNPRVDEWNAIMSKYQEGIEGTDADEVWVVLNNIY